MTVIRSAQAPAFMRESVNCYTRATYGPAPTFRELLP